MTRISRVVFLFVAVLFLVGEVALAQTPGAPSGLTGTVNSNQTVTLQWTAPATGGAPTGYIVEIGTSPGASNTSTTTIGNTTTYTTPVLSNVTHYIRVRAFNDVGVSTTSNEITVSFCFDPKAAENVSWRPLATNRIQVVWTASALPANSQTTFTVQFGSTSGASDVFTAQPNSVTPTSVIVTLPAGTYFMRVIGQACTTVTTTSVERVVVSGQAQGSSAVLVNELGVAADAFRFVELKNVSSAPVDVGGWTLLSGQLQIGLLGVLPAGTMIPAGCTFLIAPTGFSPAGDFVFPTPSGIFGGGIGLVEPGGRIRDSAAMRQEEDPGDPIYPLAEGNRLPNRSGSGAYARVADADTNDNPADFIFVTTQTPRNLAACSAGVPAAPTQVAASVNGPTVTLMWTPPVTGQPLTHYVLEVGLTPGGNEFAPITLSAGLTNITFFSAPNGTFYARLRAANAQGVSAVSNEVTIVVCAAGCTAPPGAPTQFTAQVNGNNVLLTWRRPTVGAVPTGYLLEAGTMTGLANLGQFPTGSTSEFAIVTSVPPGTYFVRVRALNGNVSGAASNEVLVIVR